MKFAAKLRGNQDIRDFQVFGERCSGTNYAEHLLAKNFRIPAVYNYGWKHGFPIMPGIWEHTLFIVMTRDPFDWAKRFFRTPYEAGPAMMRLGFSGFIRTPWASVCRPGIQGWEKWGMIPDGKFRQRPLQLDRHPIEGRAFETIFEMRSLKYRAWFG